MRADVVVDLGFGDNGKGKVCAHLAKHGSYTHCMRFSGGENAGHTIYVDGQKVVTHMVPVGTLYGKKGIIGSGCVLNVKSFMAEVEGLIKYQTNLKNLIKVAYNAHIVEDSHITEENQEVKIGTTRRGIGPAYRDKYARVGRRAEDVPELKEYLVDTYEEFYKSDQEPYVLFEGAQGHYLSIDSEYYPYVTSSNCGVGSVIQNGVSHKDITHVFGVIKAYDTYVGSARFQDDTDSVLADIGKLGQEFGATTGRKRQVAYLNMDRVFKAAKLNGISELIVNKMDILRELNVWKAVVNNKLEVFDNEIEFRRMIRGCISGPVVFSESPYQI